MAPEIVHKKPYDYRVDIWSLGVLLYELIHREAPYKGRSLSEISKSLAKDHIMFSSSTHPEAKDLIIKILRNNPNDRLSVNQILSHPWVQLHLKTEEDDSLQVEEYRVSPRDVLRQENFKSVYGESPRILPRRDHQNFKSEILVSTDNDFYIDSLGPQTRAYSNAHLFSSFNGSSSLQEKERERLREKTREKERLREKEKIFGSENQANYSGAQRRSQALEFNLNGALKAVDENIVSSRGHTKSSSTISNNILEKLSFEDKMSANSMTRKKKIFENNVLSPTFKTRVDSIIHQLSSHTTTHKNLEHTSMFGSRPASRHLQQPSQNPSSNGSAPYKYYNEFTQPNQNQQSQTIFRVKAPNRLDENSIPTNPFTSTYRVKSDVESMKELRSFQQTAKNSYQKNIILPKGDQPSLYSAMSTTNRSVRSKIGSRGSDILDQDKNFGLTHKFSNADVTRSLNLKSFGNVLSVSDQNKYKISDLQEAGSSFNKYSKGLDYKRKQGYKMCEDSLPANLHISSLSDRRNENKENKKDHLKDKENHIRIREEFTTKYAF